MSSGPVKLAIVGGSRGAAFLKVLAPLADQLQLVAFCDKREEMIARWKEDRPDLLTFTSYEKLLECPDIDAVFLATPFTVHAEQSIQALRAGKHVLSEVIAATTIEECWALVEAVEQSGLTYMMAENCLFTRSNMMVAQMAHAGLFGEISFAEGGYIHDVRHLQHSSDGTLTWRGRLRRDVNGVVYPTHSLGPLAHWLRMHEPNGDTLESMTCFVSKEVANHSYFRELFGDAHPGADRDYWRQGDSAVALIKTRNGVLIQLRYDVKSARPIQNAHYGLQGANGAFLSGRHKDEDPIVWIGGRSPGVSPQRHGEPRAEWESLWTYAEQYEHPAWRKWRAQAGNAGHGGSDFFVLDEFSSAILEKRRPLIDVYDAVMWTSVFPLSVLSVETQGKPVKFPRFNRTEAVRAPGSEA
ncbi:Gfo/Idh/MocA family protein [Paenibacillus ginsengarvi]|uniref:Gfo/Idh/MocA family protein n=1 Tax=Paenibacillus ginsengarvi TaxID=400777 RepID=UPI001315AA01|nr:Gfo/Idh/MocA family oxidoreductase [Paenibacillus ginsengarvi]